MDSVRRIKFSNVSVKECVGDLEIKTAKQNQGNPSEPVDIMGQVYRHFERVSNLHVCVRAHETIIIFSLSKDATFPR